MNRTRAMMAVSLALGAAVMYAATNFRLRVERRITASANDFAEN